MAEILSEDCSAVVTYGIEDRFVQRVCLAFPSEMSRPAVEVAAIGANEVESSHQYTAALAVGAPHLLQICCVAKPHFYASARLNNFQVPVHTVPFLKLPCY